jgi:hypothetical protein
MITKGRKLSMELDVDPKSETNTSEAMDSDRKIINDGLLQNLCGLGQGLGLEVRPDTLSLVIAIFWAESH